MSCEHPRRIIVRAEQRALIVTPRCDEKRNLMAGKSSPKCPSCGVAVPDPEGCADPLACARRRLLRESQPEQIGTDGRRARNDVYRAKKPPREQDGPCIRPRTRPLSRIEFDERIVLGKQPGPASSEEPSAWVFSVAPELARSSSSFWQWLEETYVEEHDKSNKRPRCERCNYFGRAREWVGKDPGGPEYTMGRSSPKSMQKLGRELRVEYLRRPKSPPAQAPILPTTSQGEHDWGTWGSSEKVSSGFDAFGFDNWAMHRESACVLCVKQWDLKFGSIMRTGAKSLGRLGLEDGRTTEKVRSMFDPAAEVVMPKAQMDELKALHSRGQGDRTWLKPARKPRASPDALFAEPNLDEWYEALARQEASFSHSSRDTNLEQLEEAAFDEPEEAVGYLPNEAPEADAGSVADIRRPASRSISSAQCSRCPRKTLVDEKGAASSRGLMICDICLFGEGEGTVRRNREITVALLGGLSIEKVMEAAGLASATFYGLEEVKFLGALKKYMRNYLLAILRAAGYSEQRLANEARLSEKQIGRILSDTPINGSRQSSSSELSLETSALGVFLWFWAVPGVFESLSYVGITTLEAADLLFGAGGHFYDLRPFIGREGRGRPHFFADALKSEGGARDG